MASRKREWHSIARSAFRRICASAGTDDSNRRQSHDRHGARAVEEIGFLEFSLALKRDETRPNEEERTHCHREPQQDSEQQWPPPYHFQRAAGNAAADQKKRCRQS